jgi:hypothetical protein
MLPGSARNPSTRNIFCAPPLPISNRCSDMRVKDTQRSERVQKTSVAGAEQPAHHR